MNIECEIEGLIIDFKHRADSAYAWMEGAALAEFCRHEGMFVAYTEATIELKKLLLRLKDSYKISKMTEEIEELDGD